MALLPLMPTAVALSPNPAMEQLTGLGQEEVMGKSGMDVFSAFLDAKTMQNFHFHH